LLEGRNINLRAREREDIDWLTEYFNLGFTGEYDPVTPQRSKTERLKDFDSPSQLSILTEAARFMIEKKDGTKLGTIAHWLVLPNKRMEIGYHLIPAERGKGHGTEAVQIIIDYLFLSKQSNAYKP
jgi:RimJ/RimL family protein N-acetyltransferase